MATTNNLHFLSLPAIYWWRHSRFEDEDGKVHCFSHFLLETAGTVGMKNIAPTQVHTSTYVQVTVIY